MQRLWNWARILSSGAPAPGCTVSVYGAGTLVLSTIFSDNISTPKANPFTADASTGYWFFYALQGRYDIKFSGTGITSPYTLSDVTLFDPTDGFIQSLNSQQQAAQTLVAGTAGTDFVVNSAAGVHTLNLPNAGAASRGVVSTGAQTFAGAKTFSTPIAAGSGGTGFDGSAAANGRVPIGNGAGFTLANLTAGTSMSITNGAGSITLNPIQGIRTADSPTFTGLTLSSLTPLTLSGWAATVPSSSGALGFDPATGIGTVVELQLGKFLTGNLTGPPVGVSLTAGTGIFISTSLTNPPVITITNGGISSLSSPAGAAITGALTLAVGSAGTDVAISPTVVGATTITLNVPTASATARGVISATTQVIGGVKTFNSPPLVIPGGASSSTTPGRVVTNFLRNVTTTGNVGAGEDDLSSVTLPANTLDTNGFSALQITAWGVCAANANTKTIKLYFGSAVIGTLSNATTFNGTHWVFRARVVRIASANQDVLADGVVSAANAAAPVGITVLRTAPTQDLTAAVTIKLTGTAVADNDIQETMLMVEILY